MSTVLNKIFRIAIIGIVLILCQPANSHGQCSLTKIQQGGILLTETQPSYQYLRATGVYEAVSIKAGIVSTTNSSVFYAEIKYTTKKVGVLPLKVEFGFQDGHSLLIPVKIVATPKTDNAATFVKNCHAELTAANVAALKANTLTQINFVYASGKKSVIIPVSDGAFMQRQLNCLEQGK